MGKEQKKANVFAEVTEGRRGKGREGDYYKMVQQMTPAPVAQQQTAPTQQQPRPIRASVVSLGSFGFGGNPRTIFSPTLRKSPI